jgi:hypothetical protein
MNDFSQWLKRRSATLPALDHLVVRHVRESPETNVNGLELTTSDRFSRRPLFPQPLWLTAGFRTLAA